MKPSRLSLFALNTIVLLMLAACSQTLAPDPVLTPTATVETISSPDGGANVAGGFSLQTFTPTQSGFITKVTLYPKGSTGLEAIRFYEGAGPGGFLLQGQPVTWVAGTQEITLTSPLQVTAGQTYSFDPIGSVTFGLSFDSSTDPYSGGEVWLDYTSSPPKFGWWGWAECAAAGSCNAGFADYAFIIVIEDLVDTTAPVITAPDDVTLEAPAADTSPTTTGTATVTDDTDPTPTISFSDVNTPGSCTANFTITRTWTATDASGNSASAVQTIAVEDTTAPSITAPGDVTVIQGESVDPADTGTATASDSASGVTVSFSDTVNGDITRTWTATDDCGNFASAVQTITVLTAQEALEGLIDEVEGLGLHQGIENSLVKKLSNAIRNLDNGDNAGATEKLMSFIDEVNAQTGKKISAGDAPSLIALAQRILALI